MKRGDSVRVKVARGPIDEWHDTTIRALRP